MFGAVMTKSESYRQSWDPLSSQVKTSALVNIAAVIAVIAISYSSTVELSRVFKHVMCATAISL